MIQGRESNPTFQQKLWLVASKPDAAAFAYDRLLVCRSAAELQMRRIWDAVAAARAAVPEWKGTPESMKYYQEAKLAYGPLLFEVHFYFVAWSNCGNMLRVITGQPEFLRSKKTFDFYRKHFEHYSAARNSFEHYHERLPSSVDAARVRPLSQNRSSASVQIYFGFEDGKYKHSDQSWDITSASLALLNKAVDETLHILRLEVDEIFKAKCPI